MYLPEAQKDVIWTTVGSPWALVAIWFFLMGIVTFFVFGLDKLKAKRWEKGANNRRIPERTLFLLSAVGGSVGALLGMRVWRHKTLHKSFRFGIPAILLVQLLLLGGAYWYFVIR